MSEATITAHPIHVAGGMRMMARHLCKSVSTLTAHPDRLTETADAVRALLHDAKCLVGEDQHDREIWQEVSRLEDAVDRRTSCLECGEWVERVDSVCPTCFGKGYRVVMNKHGKATGPFVEAPGQWA